MVVVSEYVGGCWGVGRRGSRRDQHFEGSLLCEMRQHKYKVVRCNQCAQRIGREAAPQLFIDVLGCLDHCEKVSHLEIDICVFMLNHRVRCPILEFRYNPVAMSYACLPRCV